MSVTELVGPERPTRARRHRATETVQVKLERHVIDLGDGRHAGVSVAGRGAPLVIINGFTAEGFLYAQTASRLVSMGWKVIAIDTPGHGRSSALPSPRGGIRYAAGFIEATLDRLGVETCVLLGHSTGGRIASEVALDRPHQAAAVMLVDAIAGKSWDERISRMAHIPGYGVLVGAEFLVDLLKTTALRPDPRQLVVVARALGRSALGSASNPLRFLNPGLAILTAPPSHDTLRDLHRLGVPTIVIHGDADGLVPPSVGQDAAKTMGGPLVVVEDGGHMWPLQDPEVLPGIVADLLRDELGDAYARIVLDAGLDPGAATVDGIEEAAYDADSLIRTLTPELTWERGGIRRPPRHTWRVYLAD